MFVFFSDNVDVNFVTELNTEQTELCALCSIPEFSFAKILLKKNMVQTVRTSLL